jgi:predicted DNA-binding transcriptional regulator YafY
MRRNRQLVRTLRLIDVLRRGRWTLVALAHELHVTDRTVRRDLEALEEAHVPVVKYPPHECGELPRFSLARGTV